MWSLAHAFPCVGFNWRVTRRRRCMGLELTCSAFFQRDTDAGRVHVHENGLKVRIGGDGVTETHAAAEK